MGQVFLVFFGKYDRIQDIQQVDDGKVDREVADFGIQFLARRDRQVAIHHPRKVVVADARDSDRGDAFSF